MEVTVWGARGSIPVSGPEYVRYGGDTTCLEVRGRGESLLIDAGTGIRRAELRARAFDLAASRLAELDAGLVAVGDLGAERPRDDGLTVAVELVGDSAESLSRARATVRDTSGGEGIEPPIVAVHERMVVVRERTERRSR